MRYVATYPPSARCFVSVFAAIVLAGGCTHTIEPHPPEVSKSPATAIKLSPRSLDRTSQSGTALPVARPVESLLPITLAGDLSALQDAAGAAVPDAFDETRSPLGRTFRWTFQRQGTPQVFVENGQLVVHAEYRGDIELKSSTAAACHLDPVYPTLDWRAPLMTKQNGGTVVIRPDTPEASIGLKPESDDKCNMFSGPLKEQVAELVNLTEVKDRIARAMMDTAVALPIRDVWAQLHGPYVAPVPSLLTPICIYPGPSELTLGPVEGTLQQAVLHGVAKVDAQALLAEACERPRIGPEKIGTGTRTVPLGRAFILTTMLPVSYQTVGRRLEENLFHTDVVLPEKGLFGERKVRIENVSASHGGGKVLITVETSGYVNGPLYFLGTPQLDGTILSMADVQLDVETRRALDAEKAGLWNQVDQALKDKVRRAARLDLAEQTAAVKKAVGGRHKAGDVILDLAVSDLRPQRVYATPHGLITEVNIEGSAKAEGRMRVQAASSGVNKPTQPTQPTTEPQPQDASTTEQRRQELFGTPPGGP